jgi:hypothetical protein
MLTNQPNNHANIINNVNNKKDKNEGLRTCMLICGFSIFIISFVVSYGVYFCYSIYALSKVSDNTVRDICHGSIMWRYVLCSIIVPFALGSSKNKKEQDNGFANLFALGFCWFTASIIMTIFGGIEVYETDCEKEFSDNKNTELLYNLGVIGFGLYFAISILLFIIMFVSSCYICCNSNDKSNNHVEAHNKVNVNNNTNTDEDTV